MCYFWSVSILRLFQTNFSLSAMAVRYHANYKRGHLIGQGLKIEHEDRKSSRKCHIFELSEYKISLLSANSAPLTPGKSVKEAWIYGPATCLQSRAVVYPCSHFKCAVPCPCLLCARNHPRCRVPVSEACKCKDCITHTKDHEIYH